MPNKRAVVLGGSVAGLCTARALAPHCEEVVVLERDAYPDTPDNRAGVPQGRHLHLVVPKGIEQLEALLPGFAERLKAAGAGPIAFGNETAFYTAPFGWLPRIPSVGDSLLASRALLESVIRTMCRETPNVRVIENAEVAGIVIEGQAARGVRYRVKGDATETTLDADLVVDATGKTSKVVDWLKAAGFDPPPMDVVDTLSGYATQIFEAPAERPADRWWKFIRLDYRLGDEKMAGILMPIEGNRLLVTLAGVAGNHPPTDAEGFMKVIESFPTPILAEALRGAKPISRVAGSRATQNERLRFEKWAKPLAHFVAVGDAAIRTNPAHGLGVTGIAWVANQIGALAKSTPWDSEAFPRAVFRAQAKVHEALWQYSTSIDLQRPETVGERPAHLKYVKPYMERFVPVAHAQAAALGANLLGLGLHLASPSTLFTPTALAGVVGTIFKGIPKGHHGKYPPAA